MPPPALNGVYKQKSQSLHHQQYSLDDDTDYDGGQDSCQSNLLTKRDYSKQPFMDPRHHQAARKMHSNHHQSETSSKRRMLENSNEDDNRRSSSSCCGIILHIFLFLWLFITLMSVIVYFAPMEDPQIEPKIANHRPRPEFVGALAMNERLDDAELMFQNQFHAPESLAWRRSSNATFFTTVEGGFILEVDPWLHKWHIVAQLNSPNSQVLDESDQATFIDDSRQLRGGSGRSGKTMKYCERDVESYGEEAKTLPKAVILSRCSRPLGIRLSPDESYLYVVDPFSGLFHINLASKTTTRLIDFAALDVRFADDLAVKWGKTVGDADMIYISDCSRRWTLRYLIRMMIENDDTGRLLEYNSKLRELRPLSSGGQGGSLRPVKIMKQPTTTAAQEQEQEEYDWRNLSFPNGVELTANSSALLVSDLNNRRILMHHLEGPLRGETRHLLWVPGYSDNIKRGLNTQDGRPTYWLACGCAVSDGKFEIAEFFNQFPLARKLALKLVHYVGTTIEWLGQQTLWTPMENAGFEIKSMWLKKDPYCTHGLVMQFDESGQVLRTLHAPHFSSNFKIVSEAHEVPDPEQPSSLSHLFIGSVYYSYLGHLELKML